MLNVPGGMSSSAGSSATQHTSPAHLERNSLRMQDNPLHVSELTTCRYGDTAFPEPGEHIPQQIHIMPAGARYDSHQTAGASGC